jgi:radical SAM protein (TIGR04043 family)
MLDDHAARARDLPLLLGELQALGARWEGPDGDRLSRRGGAGPSDHRAIGLDGHTIMVPVHTAAAGASPFALRRNGVASAVLMRDGLALAEVTLPRPPRFYACSTSDGVPYWKIAQLHATDVLATTVLQSCVRYVDRAQACQFCAIGRSLEAAQTIARKTPSQLAEVAAAAVRLDGVKHMVMTTGTPATPDRGARVLAECAAAVTERVALPIQAQCEPPDDPAWFERLARSGVVSLGMHLEAVTEEVRLRIMPGKAQVPVSVYLRAFEQAVRVFGRGQVTTYILAGLGDSREAVVATSRVLAAMGVYPFVVPFVPIRGTPLEAHPPPDPAYVHGLLAEVAAVVRAAGLSRERIAAGCGRCGACSTLQAHEASP